MWSWSRREPERHAIWLSPLPSRPPTLARVKWCPQSSCGSDKTPVPSRPRHLGPAGIMGAFCSLPLSDGWHEEPGISSSLHLRLCVPHVSFCPISAPISHCPLARETFCFSAWSWALTQNPENLRTPPQNPGCSAFALLREAPWFLGSPLGGSCFPTAAFAPPRVWLGSSCSLSDTLNLTSLDLDLIDAFSPFQAPLQSQAVPALSWRMLFYLHIHDHSLCNTYHNSWWFQCPSTLGAPWPLSSNDLPQLLIAWDYNAGLVMSGSSGSCIISKSVLLLSSSDFSSLLPTVLQYWDLMCHLFILITFHYHPHPFPSYPCFVTV